MCSARNLQIAGQDSKERVATHIAPYVGFVRARRETQGRDILRVLQQNPVPAARRFLQCRHDGHDFTTISAIDRDWRVALDRVDQIL